MLFNPSTESSTLVRCDVAGVATMPNVIVPRGAEFPVTAQAVLETENQTAIVLRCESTQLDAVGAFMRLSALTVDEIDVQPR